MNEIDTKKREMYMANVRNLHLGPNATYIPLTCVGVSRWGKANFEICVGGNAKFSVFRCQRVGIPNTKFCVGGLSQHKDPTQILCVTVEYRL